MLSRLVVSGHSPDVRHRRTAISLTWGQLLLALALFWLLTGSAEAARAADDPLEPAQVWTVCPAGPPHAPLVTRWVDKPFAFFAVTLSGGHETEVIDYTM